MKRVHFVGQCLKDLKKFPEEVRRQIGFALFLAQTGDKAVNAMPLVGFGSAKVLEVVVDYDRGTYRAVYTVKFAEAVYGLHAFQKKSRKGIETPKPDIRLIRERLKLAEAHYTEHYVGKRKDVAQ
jgi:phage-related protein